MKDLENIPHVGLNKHEQKSELTQRAENLLNEIKEKQSQ